MFSSVLTWCLYHYSKHPEVRARIDAELREAFPDNETIQEEAIRKLPSVNYLFSQKTFCLLESWRIFSC